MRASGRSDGFSIRSILTSVSDLDDSRAISISISDKPFVSFDFRTVLCFARSPFRVGVA